MGCYFLLQGVFLTEGLNPHLLHWEVVLFVRLFCFYHWVTHEVTIVSHVGHIMGYIFIYLYTSLSWHNSLSFFLFFCLFFMHAAYISSVMSNPLWPYGLQPGVSSVHGFSQARVQKWLAIPSSKGSSWPKDWSCISYIFYIERQILYL